MAESYKFKYMFSLRSTISTIIYTREIKIYAHKNKNVYKILIHNSPKLETIFMSVNRTTDKNFHILSIH